MDSRVVSKCIGPWDGVRKVVNECAAHRKTTIRNSSIDFNEWVLPCQMHLEGCMQRMWQRRFDLTIIEALMKNN